MRRRALLGAQSSALQPSTRPLGAAAGWPFPCPSSPTNDDTSNSITNPPTSTSSRPIRQVPLPRPHTLPPLPPAPSHMSYWSQPQRNVPNHASSTTSPATRSNIASLQDLASVPGSGWSNQQAVASSRAVSNREEMDDAHAPVTFNVHPSETGTSPRRHFPFELFDSPFLQSMRRSRSTHSRTDDGSLRARSLSRPCPSYPAQEQKPLKHGCTRFSHQSKLCPLHPPAG
ncbi:uncharacterized protein IWZ02DRAFT_522289 [Phyllosticta citriasiana]|uniref:uncharacterized protein n=1 Tax=Phyllosticta citriasiana TaxID=595635 RepID=UPI0030FD4F29